MIPLGNDWDDILKEEFQKDYYLALREFLKSEYSSRRIYPPMYDIFNALRYTSYENSRVVILGQDPYHGAGPRALFFGKARPSPAAFLKEYIQGAL